MLVKCCVRGEKSCLWCVSGGREVCVALLVLPHCVFSGFKNGCQKWYIANMGGHVRNSVKGGKVCRASVA